ncbi:MAG: hypothetical protein AB7P04_14805, partial [Bacteriovoracia bacterium]
KQMIQEGAAKVVLTTTFKENIIHQRLSKSGCSEVLLEPVPVKGFEFKLRRHLGNLQKIFDARTRAGVQQRRVISAKKDGDTGAARESAKGKVKLGDPIRIQSDCWVMKGGSCRKVMGKWMVKLRGPSPHVGRWVELPSTSGDSQHWQWTPNNPDQDEFVLDKGAWVFKGHRPDFQGEAWSFVGKSPELVFVFDNKPIATKVKVDEENALVLAKDSPAALQMLGKIMASLERVVRLKGEGPREEAEAAKEIKDLRTPEKEANELNFVAEAGPEGGTEDFKIETDDESAPEWNNQIKEEDATEGPADHRDQSNADSAMLEHRGKDEPREGTALDFRGEKSADGDEDGDWEMQLEKAKPGPEYGGPVDEAENPSRWSKHRVDTPSENPVDRAAEEVEGVLRETVEIDLRRPPASDEENVISSPDMKAKRPLKPGEDEPGSEDLNAGAGRVSPADVAANGRASREAASELGVGEKNTEDTLAATAPETRADASAATADENGPPVVNLTADEGQVILPPPPADSAVESNPQLPEVYALTKKIKERLEEKKESLPEGVLPMELTLPNTRPQTRPVVRDTSPAGLAAEARRTAAEIPKELAAPQPPGPSLSPLAIAFLMSELASKPDMNLDKIGVRFCAYLGASCGGIQARLWFKRGAEWACVGSSQPASEDSREWIDQVVAKQISQPQMLTERVFVCPVESDAYLILNGEGAQLVEGKYLLGVARSLHGYLLSQRARAAAPISTPASTATVTDAA